jgi:hypothetical protein
MATYNANTTGKEFEKPDNGEFVGVIVDVINGIVRKSKQPPFADQVKTRVVWLLNARDSEGNYFRVSREVNSKVSAIPGRRKSSFYELIEQVVGEVPAVFDDETLIGRSNNIFVLREKGDDGKTYANIKGILPLKPGQTPMTVPAGFVRSKDKQPQVQQRQVSPAVIPQAVAADEQF